MQLLHRRRPLIVLICATLVLLIQQVAWAQDSSEVERLREEQAQIGCQLKYNETLRADFFYGIGSRKGSL